MSEVIIPKPYNHTAKNIWEACGFKQKEMEDQITSLKDSLSPQNQPSKILEFIESLEISARQKIVLAYYICGMHASAHFERVTQNMTAMTAKTMEGYRAEIRRLGGSTNPAEFGKKAPAKRNRIKK